MKIINIIRLFLWKFAKISFKVTGIIINYIARETGEAAREATKPSNPPRIWWW